MNVGLDPTYFESGWSGVQDPNKKMWIVSYLNPGPYPMNLFLLVYFINKKLYKNIIIFKKMKLF